ncbi:MAG: class II aldolase/adducin family protein [Verrucomicrobia bacterium]|nr:class II aldolase/adducin family protein [Verrucomicrobiota bacterium]MBV9642182.1 class II aldolase/adducin family protein [Verrucomicrobiota bacterium]
MPQKGAVLVRSQLIELSREFGQARWAILGEGNTSGRVDEKVFAVKSSGSSLGTLTEIELTECYFGKLIPLLDRKSVPEEEVENVLLASRVLPTTLKPSVETFFHAYLLTIPGVNYVGHTHPVPVNQILCSNLGASFAEERRFPDEVVCCGPVSLLIPYEDPGLALAVRIRRDMQSFERAHGRNPKVILLGNHGVITIGQTTEAVRVAMAMTVKAAEIFVGAHALGGNISMPQSEVNRIENRLDEEYRRKMLRV